MEEMESSRLILRWCPDKTPPSLTTPQNIFYQFDFFSVRNFPNVVLDFPILTDWIKAPNYWESVSKGGPSVQTLFVVVKAWKFSTLNLTQPIYTCEFATTGLVNLTVWRIIVSRTKKASARMACDRGGVILLDFADKACQNSWKLTDAAVMACAWWGPGAGQPASIVKNEKKIIRQHLGAAADSSEMRGWFGVYPRLLLLPRERRGMTVNNYRRVECSRTKSLYSLIQWEFRCCISTGDGHGVQRGHRISLGHWK